MDIKLPEMDGYSATMKIKEFRNNLPIIAHTAYVRKDEKSKVLSAGCDELITKPYVAKEFIHTVSRYLA